MKEKGDTFYDIHMHAFNLSHPYFYAFLRRFKLLPESLLETGFKYIALAVAGIVIIFGILFGVVTGLVYLFGGLHFVVAIVISVIVCVLVALIILVCLRSSLSLRRKILRPITGAWNKINNMLSVFENDIGSFFLVIENCLRETKKNDWEPPLIGNSLTIDENKYQRIILTPLMMDFGQKGKDPEFGFLQDKRSNVKKNQAPQSSFHYDEIASKPVVEQVIDVLNAIRWYRRATFARYSTRLSKVYYTLTAGTQRFMEIYPFMAVHPHHYELVELKNMLIKYFPDNKVRREELFKNLGAFKGDPATIRGNFFAGIKVYPPLGFDPWPEWDKTKVTALYEYCCKHHIPLTTHGGSGGFAAIEDEKTLLDYTSIVKWQEVLKNFKELKLNIAHFPAEFLGQEKSVRADNRRECERLKAMIRLILDYDHVYTDFSCRACTEEYYMHLNNVLQQQGDQDRAKLTKRILFGSDFAVCLGGIDSYNHYVHIFSQTKYLKPEEKHAFCCQNPQEFLFGDRSG
jgi:hypothetical protein